METICWVFNKYKSHFKYKSDSSDEYYGGHVIQTTRDTDIPFTGDWDDNYSYLNPFEMGEEAKAILLNMEPGEILPWDDESEEASIELVHDWYNAQQSLGVYHDI